MRRTFIILSIAALFVVMTCKQKEVAPAQSAAVTRSAGSSTTVSVHLTGLYALIDKFDTLPDPNKPMPKTLNIANFQAHHHLPVLVYSGTLAPADYRAVVAETTPVPYSFIQLQGEELEFGYTDSSGNFVSAAEGNALTYDETAPATCSSEQTNLSLFYLPRVSNFVSVAGNPLKLSDLDEEYTAARPNGTKLAGLVDLGFGNITTTLKNSLIWGFKNDSETADSGWKQQVAQETVWTFTIPSNELSVRSKPFGGTTRDLLKIESDANGKINLALANLMRSDIVYATGYSGGQPPRLKDEHFALAYQLLKVPPAAQYIPIAVGACVSGAQSFDCCDVKNRLEKTSAEGLCVNVTCPSVPLTMGGVNCGGTNWP